MSRSILFIFCGCFLRPEGGAPTMPPQSQDEAVAFAVAKRLDGQTVRIGRQWRCDVPCELNGEVTVDTLLEHLRIGVKDMNLQYAHCIEHTRHYGLKTQLDIDLRCTRQDIIEEGQTCSDHVEEGPFKNYKEDLYEHCDNNESLITAHCKLHCRFGEHPTKRCIHEIDRDGLFGLRQATAVRGSTHLHSCVVARVCEFNGTNRRTMSEIHCNRTDGGDEKAGEEEVIEEKDNAWLPTFLMLCIISFFLLVIIICLSIIICRMRPFQRGSRGSTTPVVVGRPVNVSADPGACPKKVVAMQQGVAQGAPPSGIVGTPDKPMNGQPIR